MTNRSVKRFDTVGLLIVMAIVLLFMAACGVQKPSETEEQSDITSAQEASNQEQTTRIAIRNSSSWGGLAAMAGELLKDEGYVYENGYTIDIANTDPVSKSLILVQNDNDAAYQDAMKISEIFNFKVVVDKDRFDFHLQDFNEKESGGALVIVFAEGDFDSSFTNKYADIVSKYDYPPQKKGDYTVLQIEPR